MSDTIITVFIIIFAIFFIGRPIYIIQNDKRKIRNVLKKKNMSNIVVNFIPFTTERNTLFYDVIYEDETGRFYATKCKKYWWDSTIYWMDEDPFRII